MHNTSHHSYKWELPALASCVSLGGGMLTFSEPEHIVEENEPGLKLVVVLGGCLSYRMPDEGSISVTGPSCHVTFSESPYSVQHRFGGAVPLRYITVRIPLETLADDFGVDVARLSRHFGSRLDLSPIHRDAQPDKTILTLGRQMLSHPLGGPLRSMYLSGKALELTATVMTTLMAQTNAGQAPPNSRDTQRLYQARDILLQTLQSPPTLPELARLAGINVSKLTSGFRRTFGHSVYGYVRDQRLQLAHRMLATGEISVADAAHACGYTDSHFTKVFRKRYGVAPSELG